MPPEKPRAQKIPLSAPSKAIEEVAYEGFGPHRVAMIVECQTDNRVRTAADIRNLFNKNGGQLGEIGSVGWMFERVSLIEGSNSKKDIDGETEAIEAGANEVEKNDDGSWSFYSAPEDLKIVETALISRGFKIQTAELSFKPKQITELTEAQKKEVLEFIEVIDDNDDTHRIHATFIP
jgi:YebC/PmpR family DNA-binding regulatory protein